MLCCAEIGKAAFNETDMNSPRASPLISPMTKVSNSRINVINLEWIVAYWLDELLMKPADCAAQRGRASLLKGLLLATMLL